LKLEILRGDQRKILYVPAIEQRDPMDQLFDAADPEKSLISRLGILATDITGDLRNQIGTLRIASGVIVLGRAADLITPDTGLQTGDVIHSLNNTPITSMEELRAAVQSLKTGDPVVLQVERSDGLSYLSFEME
jgi:serine protease Do